MELRKRKKGESRLTKTESWTQKIISKEEKRLSNRVVEAKSSNSKIQSTNKDDQHWEVEQILDERTNRAGNKEVLIKWKGWSSKFNSWEPVENLSDNLESALETLRKTKLKKSVKPVKQLRAIRRKKIRFQPRHGSSNWGIIEDIRDEKVENGETYYLIKWRNYGEEFNSWEPRKNLTARDISALKNRINREKMQMQTSRRAINQNSTVNQAVRDTKDIQLLGQQISQVKELEQNTLVEELEVGFVNAIDVSEKEFNEDKCIGNPASIPFDECQKKVKSSVKQQKTKLKESLDEECNQQATNSMANSENSIHCQVTHAESLTQRQGDNFGVCLESKGIYSHKIQCHIVDESGEIEAFKIIATKQADFSGDEVPFWCYVTEAKEKFSKEVLEYMMDLMSRFLID